MAMHLPMLCHGLAHESDVNEAQFAMPKSCPRLASNRNLTRVQKDYVPWGMLAACEQTQTLKVETQHAIPDYAILTQCHADTNPLTNQTLWLVVQAKSKPRDGQWVLVYHPPSQAIVWCTIHIQGSSIEFHPLDQKTNRLTPSQIHWIGVITSTHTSL